MSQSVTQGRVNNFSILRLLFAALVILSHSFELTDGNRLREPLTRLFGTISLGVLAVDGFFIVSGYLITKSYLSSAPKQYLVKRILRIYPGFVVAFIVSIALCMFLSVPSVRMNALEILDNALNMAALIPPGIKGAYPGSHYPTPNASMWSISYEFHCYLMITLLGFFGLFKRPKILLLLTIALAAVYWSYPQNLALGDASSSIPVSAGLGTQILRKFTAITLESPTEDVRLLSIFLAGSCFYMFRNVIVFRAAYAVPAMIMLVGCLFSRRLAESGIAIFGGYIIFWFALHIEAFSISQFFNKTDLSYGIYLYAWPIQQALISQLPQITPVELFFLSLGFSLIIAFFSWSFVEKPFLNLKQPSTPRGGVS